MNFVKIDGAIAVIAVKGKYDLLKVLEVEQQLTDAMNSGCIKVLVDFDDTTYIDSSVIRALIKIRRRIKHENFAYRNAKGDVLTALQIAKLDTLWNKA